MKRKDIPMCAYTVDLVILQIHFKHCSKRNHL